MGSYLCANCNGKRLAVVSLIDDELVISFGDVLQPALVAGRCEFEGKSVGEVEYLIQEQLCIFVVEALLGHEAQREGTGRVGLVEVAAADGICIGVR